MSDLTYRMLGREHEAADLEREADKWRRAAEAREQVPVSTRATETKWRAKTWKAVRARIAALPQR